MLSILCWYYYGECDFSKANPKGPYAVGFKEFHLKNPVSVFYPVDKEDYKRISTPTKYWLDYRNQENWVEGL